MPNKLISQKSGPQAAVKTPIGLVKIFTSDSAVIRLEINKTGRAVEATDATAAQAATEITAYFEGSQSKPRVKLRLAGTEFQLAVWRELAKLGFGQQASYKDIAVAIGRPAAARAVGAAVGANPIPLLLGCHRVLGHQSKITGYSGGEGLKTKAWLLHHEKISFAGL